MRIVHLDGALSSGAASSTLRKGSIMFQVSGPLKRGASAVKAMWRHRPASQAERGPVRGFNVSASVGPEELDPQAVLPFVQIRSGALVGGSVPSVIVDNQLFVHIEL